MCELFRRLEQPVREAVGKAAKHCDLIGRGIVDLPKDDADVIGMRDRDAVAFESARMQINRHALGQHVPGARTGYSDDGARIGLVDDRTQTIEQRLELAQSARFGVRNRTSQPGLDVGDLRMSAGDIRTSAMRAR